MASRSSRYRPTLVTKHADSSRHTYTSLKDKDKTLEQAGPALQTKVQA